MLDQRRSGILLHPTSLPGPQPVGSLGEAAYRFVDWLVSAGQSVWQVLPLGPTGYGDCPYSCYSAFAGNPLLIDLQQLANLGDLALTDLPALAPANNQADFDAAKDQLLPLLHQAHVFFKTHGSAERQKGFTRFCAAQGHWLDDYALFMAIREQQQQRPWQDWPADIRQRQAQALDQWSDRLADEIDRHKYIQFIFAEQWNALKHYANERGVLIFGDLPIFVAEDSADIWANQELFHLNEDGRPSLVAGVPPDYFSSTGQRWGNPLYHWERVEAEDFRWWLSRFKWNFELFDLLRVDHFRGFTACWAIPAQDETAENGHWLEAPGDRLFTRLNAEHPGQLPIIAEDLGIITPEVEELRDKYAFPGMKVLQFAFDSDARNPYLPHNLQQNSVTYTGTHDNNTSLGWWQEQGPQNQARVSDYLGSPPEAMPWPLIRAAQAGVSRLAILPLQDVLALPASARMNRPGTANGNWHWRTLPDALSAAGAEQLRRLSHLYGRDLCFPTEM